MVYGTYESYEQYIDICTKIVALYEESESVNVILCEDFNCQPGSRFYSLYTDLISRLNLVESNVTRLPNSFTTATIVVLFPPGLTIFCVIRELTS